MIVPGQTINKYCSRPCSVVSYRKRDKSEKICYKPCLDCGVEVKVHGNCSRVRCETHRIANRNASRARQNAARREQTRIKLEAARAASELRNELFRLSGIRTKKDSVRFDLRPSPVPYSFHMICGFRINNNSIDIVLLHPGLEEPSHVELGKYLLEVKLGRLLRSDEFVIMKKNNYYDINNVYLGCKERKVKQEAWF